MTAPDPALVEAAIKAWQETWTRYTVAPGENDARILMLRLTDTLAAVEPLIRESIARQIEAQATTQECVSARTWGPPIGIFCGCWVCADQRAVAKFAAIARGAP